MSDERPTIYAVERWNFISKAPDGHPKPPEDLPHTITGDEVEVCLREEPAGGGTSRKILARVQVVDMQDGLTPDPSDCRFIGKILGAKNFEDMSNLPMARLPAAIDFGLHSVYRVTKHGPMNIDGPLYWENRDSISCVNDSPPLGSKKVTYTVQKQQDGPWTEITPVGARTPLLLCRNSALAHHLAAFLSSVQVASDELSRRS